MMYLGRVRFLGQRLLKTNLEANKYSETKIAYGNVLNIHYFGKHYGLKLLLLKWVY